MESEFYRFALIRNYLSKVIQSIENGNNLRESLLVYFDENTKSRICRDDISEEVIYNLAREVSEFILSSKVDDNILHQISEEVIKLCKE